MSFKKSLRKVIPVRASVFEKYKEDQREHNAEMLKQYKELKTRLNAQTGQMAQSFELLIDKNNELMKMLQATRIDISDIKEGIVSARQDINIVGNISREANWANVFHDTIVASNWFMDIPLSPGRWAIGYQYLYVLYRALDAMKPHNILEFGLGESTTVINAYAKTHDRVSHTVIEHDSNWIEFYSSKNEVTDVTDIVQCDLELIQIPEVAHEVRIYKDYIQRLQEKNPDTKYDLISVDGPFGYDMSEAARVDALALIPDKLAKSFVIMIDDYNRAGEKGMGELLKERLDEASIEYTTGVYRGEKTTFVVASNDLAFLCSL